MHGKMAARITLQHNYETDHRTTQLPTLEYYQYGIYTKYIYIYYIWTLYLQRKLLSLVSIRVWCVFVCVWLFNK